MVFGYLFIFRPCNSCWLCTDWRNWGQVTRRKCANLTGKDMRRSGCSLFYITIPAHSWRNGRNLGDPQLWYSVHRVLLECKLCCCSVNFKEKKGEFVFYTCYVIINCFVHQMIIRQLFCNVNDRNINAFDSETSLFLHIHPLSMYLQTPCCQSSFISGCS